MILTRVGVIISQISTATGRFTLVASIALMVAKTCGMRWPSRMPAIMQRKTQAVRSHLDNEIDS